MGLRCLSELSARELLGYFRNLKKRTHAVREGLGPELRARNRRENLPHCSFRLREDTVAHFLHIKQNDCKYEYKYRWEYSSQALGTPCDAPGAVVNSFAHEFRVTEETKVLGRLTHLPKAVQIVSGSRTWFQATKHLHTGLESLTRDE